MVRVKAHLARALPYAITLAVFAGLTLVLAVALDDGHITVVSLVFLLATLLVAGRWGYREGMAAAVLANLLVNFFFVPPLHRFAVSEPENLAALAVFLAVAFVGAYMLSRMREQTRHALEREAETAALLQASRETAQARTPREALDRLSTALARAAGAKGCAVLAGEPLAVAGATIDGPSALAPTRDEVAVAKEALRLTQVARYGGAAGGRPMTFVPIPGVRPAVLRLSGMVEGSVVEGAVVQALAHEVTATLERARLAGEAEAAVTLQRADELKSALLSSVSHDLRTPLTAIKAAVSSLRDDSVAWTDEDRAAFLESIESQTDRLTRTVANLLEMSRLETGAARAKLEAIEAGPLLEEVALATRDATRGREVSRCAAPGAWLRADYGLLTQALVNLVENAAKYSPADSPIRLEASSSPGRALIRVTDEGPGIAPADLPHIFEKFTRGTTTAASGGSGLGLAIVKAMVELCGGHVAAESAPGRTTFTISLPSAVAPS